VFHLGKPLPYWQILYIPYLKGLQETNTLAYCQNSFITATEFFITLALIRKALPLVIFSSNFLDSVCLPEMLYNCFSSLLAFPANMLECLIVASLMPRAYLRVDYLKDVSYQTYSQTLELFTLF
jgi:hypothetical protein